MGMLHGAFEVIGGPPAATGQPAAIPNKPAVSPAEASPAPASISPASPARPFVESYRIEAGFLEEDRGQAVP